jgi:hypothetical protein
MRSGSAPVPVEVNWHVVSEVLKPVPETATKVPEGPSEGTTTIVGTNGFVTVKRADALSPLGLPVTVIEYVPAATLPTLNEAVALLPVTVVATVQVPDVTTLPVPEIEHDVSVEGKSTTPV